MEIKINQQCAIHFAIYIVPSYSRQVSNCGRNDFPKKIVRSLFLALLLIKKVKSPLKKWTSKSRLYKFAFFRFQIFPSKIRIFFFLDPSRRSLANKNKHSPPSQNRVDMFFIPFFIFSCSFESHLFVVSKKAGNKMIL